VGDLGEAKSVTGACPKWFQVLQTTYMEAISAIEAAVAREPKKEKISP